MRREFFVLILSLLGIVIAIYVSLGFAVGLIVPRISADLETKMSELFIRSLDAEDIDSEWRGYAQNSNDMEVILFELVESTGVRVLDAQLGFKLLKP